MLRWLSKRSEADQTFKPSFHKVALSVVRCPRANAYDKQRRCRWKSLIIIDEKIKMAAINKEFLLQLNLFVVLAIMRQQERKKHCFWVREIFQERQELGAYHRLIMGRVIVSFPVVSCRRDKIYPIPKTLSFSVYFCRCGSFNITTKTSNDR